MAEISECLFKKQSGPKVCGHTENLMEITRQVRGFRKSESVRNGIERSSQCQIMATLKVSKGATGLESDVSKAWSGWSSDQVTTSSEDQDTERSYRRDRKHPAKTTHVQSSSILAVFKMFDKTEGGSVPLWVETILPLLKPNNPKLKVLLTLSKIEEKGKRMIDEWNAVL